MVGGQLEPQPHWYAALDKRGKDSSAAVCLPVSRAWGGWDCTAARSRGRSLILPVNQFACQAFTQMGPGRTADRPVTAANTTVARGAIRQPIGQNILLFH